MKSTDEIVAEARRLAEELQSGMQWKPQTTAANSTWWADDISQRPAIHARGAASIEFLRTFAGQTSTWARQAEAILETGSKPVEHRVRGVGEILIAWAQQVDSGLTEVVGSSGQNARLVATTDVMDQVRVLNSDRRVHPAAPIVLAGAALETALRGAVEQRQLAIEGKGSISSYAKTLRAAELLSKQGVKDIEQMGGLRNAAAHGEFDDLSRERAGLMEQQVNLLLTHLAALLGD